jgi:hypothetical protein
LDGLANPEDRVGGEPGVPFVVEAIRCFEETNVAFGDAVSKGKPTIMRVTPGEFDDQPEIVDRESVNGFFVVFVVVLSGEFLFLVRGKETMLRCIFEVSIEIVSLVHGKSGKILSGLRRASCAGAIARFLVRL